MIDRAQHHPPHRKRQGASIVISVAIVGSLVACPLSLLAAQRGLLAPPTFAVAVGPVEISAPCLTTGDFCPPYPPYYTIWLTVRRPGLYYSDLYRLMSLKIDEPTSLTIPDGVQP
jgi:hypothetical protein